MAELRLIVTAVVAMIGCGHAGAGPDQGAKETSGLVPPAGWQALPEVAKTVREAIGKGVTIDGVEAWGETAMGCYSVWIAMRGSGDAKAMAETVLAGLAPLGEAPVPSTLEVRDVVKPTAADGVLAFSFTATRGERAGYRGRVRARLGGGKLVALACFANQREPITCDTACTGLLGALP